MPNNNGKTPQPPDPGPLTALSAEEGRGIQEFLDIVETWATDVLAKPRRARPRDQVSRRRNRDIELAVAELLIAFAQAWRTTPH